MFNDPLLLRPDKVDVVLSPGLADRLTLVIASPKPKTAREMYEVSRGVARVPVEGLLVHKLGGIDPRGMLLGYDILERVIAHALQNRDVGAVLLDIDSPGGEVAGCFALARKLAGMSQRAGGKKPIVAIANEMACSAAYAIAAACDSVITNRTGQVGSIGVCTTHIDRTKALELAGIGVTMIRAGERKARGGPYETADKATFDKLQCWVDETFDLFAELVADFRPITKEAVRSLKGDWFTGDDALAIGLVDVVDSTSELIAAVEALVA